MKGLEFNLYREDFNVVSDHGCSARIIRSILVAIIVLFVVRSLQLSKEAAIIVLPVLLLGSLFLADKYVRRLYPDWPKAKNYSGTITFSSDEIEISKQDKQYTISVNKINDLLLFYDHYRGFRNNHRDIERNGNALAYIRTIDDQIHVFKFNIHSKIQFENFELLSAKYETNIRHFRKYTPMTTKSQIKDYIAGQPEAKRSDLQALHERIQKLMPKAKLWFLDGKNEAGKVVSNPNIGYGSYTIQYKDGSEREFYQIGLSANTSGISIYVMGIKDRAALAKKFGKKLGKASVSGYCIKFKTLKDINTNVLEEAIQYGVKETTT